MLVMLLWKTNSISMAGASSLCGPRGLTVSSQESAPALPLRGVALCVALACTWCGSGLLFAGVRRAVSMQAACAD